MKADFREMQSSKGPFTYYVTQKNEFLDFCHKFFIKKNFLCFELSQNLRPPREKLLDGKKNLWEIYGFSKMAVNWW